jgi:sugar O-acyltransferase (sialic acid O-acetyltransferase NeuD family)
VITPRDLVIVGAGGFARETVELVRAANAVRPQWRLLGLLDDDKDLHGALVDGVPVLGGVEEALADRDVAVAVCVGSPRSYASRARVAERLGLPPERYATLVHPTAVVPPSCLLGPGTVVHAHVVLTASVQVGSHVAVMPHVVLTHDDVVGDYVTFGSGVRLAGGVRIGTGAYVGAGALVREYVSVGAWSLVGMGALVTRDVPAGQVWIGSPARYLRDAALPEDPPQAVLAALPDRYAVPPGAAGQPGSPERSGSPEWPGSPEPSGTPALLGPGSPALLRSGTEPLPDREQGEPS